MIYIKNFPKSGDLCPIDEYCDITGQTQHEAKQTNQYTEIVGLLSLQTYKDVQIAKLEGMLEAYDNIAGMIKHESMRDFLIERNGFRSKLATLRNESN